MELRLKHYDARPPGGAQGEHGHRRCAGTNGDGYCAHNFSGVLCQTCLQPSHYFSTSDAQCHACSDAAGNALIVTLLLLLLAAAVVGVFVAAR